MDMSEHLSDCARDVLAMADAYLAAREDPELSRESLKVLMAHADHEGCLQVAVVLLAAAYKSAAEMAVLMAGAGDPAEGARRLVAAVREEFA
jgi:hypothetical protein